MRKELPNELEPLNMMSHDFLSKAADQLFKNPDKILPVFLSTDGFDIGDYFIGIIKEDGRIFLQAEGFSSYCLESGFVIGSGEEWKKIQPGIYRLDISDFT